MSFLIIVNLVVLLTRISAKGIYAVAPWLKHYATIPKDAGSRPDKINEFFFYLPNPSSRDWLWGLPSP
jgi:hypothetical protein